MALLVFCRVGELNFGTSVDEYGFLQEDGNQIVCDACPLQPGGLVNSFGCDVYTKQCTCNRPKLQRTYCTTNQECALEGEAAASCVLASDFQRPENTHGTLPCNSCPTSQPICLVGQDTTRGVCSCMQTPPVFQSCKRSDLADRVFPDASGLCAVALDSRRVSSQTATSLDWNSLSASACAIVSPGNAYCYNVPGYGYLVVGLGVVDTSFRRRLLSVGDDDEHNQSHRQNHDNDDYEAAYTNLRHMTLAFPYWNSTLAKPCASLAHAIAFEKNLSITDMHFLESCVQWRKAGRDAITELNLTSLKHMDRDLQWEAPDRLFMSLDDFAAVLSRRCRIICNMHWCNLLFFFLIFIFAAVLSSRRCTMTCNTSQPCSFFLISNFFCRKMLLLELASKMPQAMMLLFQRSGLLDPLAKIWETLQRNSVFYAWNVLLLVNQTNATFPENITMHNRPQHFGTQREQKQAVMQALDQFVLSQHRSMKILHGGAVTFLEGHMTPALLLQAAEEAAESVVADEFPAKKEEDAMMMMASGRKKEGRGAMGHFRAKNLLLMQLMHQRHLKNQTGGPSSSNMSFNISTGGGGRSLLQMDDSIKVYSSIIAATKEYSRTSVGKTSVTDSWLQGPLQWPPR